MREDDTTESEWAELLTAPTPTQIEERFRRLFDREMTAEERFAFFLPSEK